MKNLKPVTLGVGAFLYSLMTLNSAMADDTEIYVPKDLPADQYVRPNIMFVLDSSGSMGSSVAGTTPSQNRNQVLKTVVNNLIDQIKVKEDVNVGFMRYDGNDGGYVLSPLQRLTNANATTMKGVVNAIPASGNTPLLETYYESYLYMTGKNRLWGDKSVASSLSGEKYILPISHSCQKSHIIYVTDGEPTQDQGSNATVKALVTGKNTLFPASSCGTGQGQCLPHLAEFMANQDLVPAPTPFDDPTNRKQTVTSHFIGFTVDLPLLKNAARAGGGSYYTSNNVSGLTDALKAIIVDITADNTSFAAPSVAVSAFNNLGFRNDLYYALFKPQEGARWPGNVKRYQLGRDTNNNPLIVDKNGDPAIDDSTGFFSNSSSSFWSSSDGADVTKGGVAGQLTNPDTRKVLTWTAADRSPGTGSAPLDTSANRLLDSNTGVTQSMVGATTASERTTYINWARGKNTDGTPLKSVSDVLHNEPKLVAYVTDEELSRAGTGSSPEQLYMFFGSNQGYIHAIDPKDGSEKFAFIPKELLTNPGEYYKNQKGSGNKRYGIDGQINVWTEYGNLNSGSNTRTISKAYLYAGMRRGGSNYYSLDVTNISAPALKWIIKGPVQIKPVSPSTVYTNATTGFTSGYDKLGLTYSAPKLAKIKVNNIETKVLIFTGGYDLDQDTVGTNTPKDDDIGNALFIANADTGALIWSASKSGANLNIPTMTNSMPADPTIADLNGDGFADIIFASDLRGQIFRFDINNSNTGASGTGVGTFASGGRIASLGGATAADNRRFFTSPDVALVAERGARQYFSISIGSGFRESPLNTDTNDRFYVLKDYNVSSKPSSYVTITESDLLDVSGIDSTNSAATLAAIKVLEDQILALNNAVTTSQENFKSYKAGIGYTALSISAEQARSDALDKQRQIDELLKTDPFLVQHAPNTRQQSILQDSLTRAREVLEGVELARKNAQDLADSTDAPALTLAAAAAATSLTNATNDYNAAKTTSDADAATASNTNATATTSETLATNAATAAATALTDKNNADTAASNAVTDAGIKTTAKTDADAAKATADGIAATKLAAKTAADLSLATATSDAATALSNKQAADATLTAATTDEANKLADKIAADGAVTTATNNLAIATSDKNAADNALTDAGTLTANALTAKNNADQALTDAQAALDLDPMNTTLKAARDAAASAVTAAATSLADAQAAEVIAGNVAASAATAQSNANTAHTNATTTATLAATAYTNSQTALVAATSDAAGKDALYAAAQNTLASATSDAATADAENSTAQTDAANSAAAATAANNALATANTLVTSTAATAATASTNLATANATRDSTEATATTDRSIASTAASVAAASAAVTATKLTAKNDAQTVKTAADLALNTGTADDTAALALTTQRDRMATDYETLINLQSSVDGSWAAILTKEAEITAILAADPNNDTTALEAQLATLRTNYAGLATVAKRTALNTGSPSEAVAKLNAVNAALSAGNAAVVASALSTALTALETSFGPPASATKTTSQLLARDESTKSAALLSSANNEASTAALIANLESQKATLITAADGIDSQVTTLAGGLYNPASGLLTAAQVNAAQTSTNPTYSLPLTTFDAYQYLEDQSLAAANNPTTGLPALRVQINDKYNTLTPGNSYTPNPELLAVSKGFYLRLIKGEKVLSSSITFRGAVLFSTFSPRGAATSSCGSDVGRGRIYAISVKDASAIFTTTVNGVKTPTRSFDLKRSGIPPTPSVILSNDKPTFLIGTEVLQNECVEGGLACKANKLLTPTYWREN